MDCPRCGSDYIVKNGISLSNKQKYKCGECYKQFVLNPEKKMKIDKLLFEKISLKGIARSVGFYRYGYKNMLRKNIKNNQKNFMFKKTVDNWK